MNAQIGGSLLLILLGVFGLFMCSREIQRGWASRTWPQVSALIRCADIVHDVENNRYEIDVDYGYSMNGHAFTASTIRFGSNPTFSTREDAERYLQPYQPGSMHLVHIDPKRPGIAVLLPGFSRWSLLPLAMACVPLYLGITMALPHIGY